MSYIEGFRGAPLFPQRSESRPVRVELISTFSSKHGASVGESLGSEAVAGHLLGEIGDGVSVGHFDLQLDSVDTVLSTVAAKKPDIIGLSVKIGALEQTEEVVRGIHALNRGDQRKPLILMGGVVPTFATAELLKRYPDVVMVIGEGEVASQMLVEAVAGERDFAEIPGIAYINTEGKIVINPRVLWPQSKLHLPARITTDRVQREIKGMIWAEDSRGCDYSCTFCSRRSLRGSGFSGEMSPARVVDDLEQLDKMGIHQVSFTGDDFGGDPERTDLIAEEILQRGVSMEWSISTRADHIYERKNTPEQNARLKEIMQHCVQAGLVRVFLGLESGSQSQLKRYGKQMTVEENYNAVEILRELGVDVVAGYIPIDYLMTITELRETLDFLETTGMGLKVTNPLSVLRVQEGSPYMKLMQHEGLLEEKTDDLVFYKARFKDPRIELVAAYADEWVNELYPLMFGLKGEVATVTLSKETQNSPARKIESTLHSFRRLELNYLKSIVGELEKNERIDLLQIQSIKRVFIEKRKILLDTVQQQLRSGMYGDITVSRLMSCLAEVSTTC